VVVYHPLQLLVGALLAARLQAGGRARADRDEAG
jgi:hypothetical protein